jgi:hypothetical protein
MWRAGLRNFGFPLRIKKEKGARALLFQYELKPFKLREGQKNVLKYFNLIYFFFFAFLFLAIYLILLRDNFYINIIMCKLA